MPDFGPTDLDTFRAEARDWLTTHFPASLKGKGGMMTGEGPAVGGADYAAWVEAMGDEGWGVPTWPRAYGGGGLSPDQAKILQKEMAAIGAWNPIGGMGTMMFGPTLLEYGSEEQKHRHIPPIARNEIRWCQGFSEPGAGSDLASLATKCEDKGDHWLVNGQKIWTSGAQWADWCFCLVRTDASRKHEGISFLLIDMKTPGVEVRPIKLISGASLQAFEVTLDYLKTRVQFGQVIGSFQALQHRAAKMFTDLELTRSCVEAALTAIDNKSPDTAELVSLAKAKAGDTLHLVSNEMVQMHGGIGMTDAHDAGLYLKRARAAEATYGGQSYHRDRYARLQGF
jgi:alkylation response protein AidB-like acyl-CoA dehydrogenase